MYRLSFDSTTDLLLFNPFLTSYVHCIKDKVTKKIWNLPLTSLLSSCSIVINVCVVFLHINKLLNRKKIWKDFESVSQDDNKLIFFFVEAFFRIRKKKLWRRKKRTINISTRYLSPHWATALIMCDIQSTVCATLW